MLVIIPFFLYYYFEYFNQLIVLLNMDIFIIFMPPFTSFPRFPFTYISTYFMSISFFFFNLCISVPICAAQIFLNICPSGGVQQTNQRLIIEKPIFSLSQQLSLLYSSSVRGKTLCTIPFFMLRFALTWACPDLLYIVTPTISTHAQLFCRVQKTVLLLQPSTASVFYTLYVPLSSMISEPWEGRCQ